MTRELQGIVASVRARQSFEKCALVLDIGCNDGTLLRAYEGSNAFTVGFEPAQNLVPYAQVGTGLVINDFFNAAAWKRAVGGMKAQVVTSIAMFYDLDDPNSFVRDVGEVLEDGGLWVLQMADLKSMLERNMWDNICHEHLEYYSFSALENLLSRHNFYVEDVELNSVNGGSLRAYIRKGGGPVHSSVGALRALEKNLQLTTPEPYQAFSRRVRQQTAKLNEFVKQEALLDKRIFVYGASTKGNTLLQVSGLAPYITAAAERNPDKWGKFTVGTEIPIISEQEARDQKPDYFLVLPWHFLDEFVERERTYLEAGGAFIVPLPEFRIVRA
jgi:hypothetical protein